MEFVPLLVVASLIYGIINLVKTASAGQINVVITQLVSWGAGIAVAFLLRASDFADGFLIGSGEDLRPLSTLNPFSVVLVGVALATVANVGYDLIPKNTPTLGDNSTE